MRFEEAVDTVFAAYDLDPASPEIGNEIVWVRLCCRQFEESAEQGRRIIALHPSFLEAYWSLGLAESSLGHYRWLAKLWTRPNCLALRFRLRWLSEVTWKESAETRVPRRSTSIGSTEWPSRLPSGNSTIVGPTPDWGNLIGRCNTFSERLT